MGIVGDVGQEVDVATQPRESDRNVEGATTDVLVGLDDVDQRFADHQPAAHRTKASNVARAPLECNESNAQRYASTKRGSWARFPNTAVISMNAVGFSCCDLAIGTSESANWSTTSIGLPPSQATS